MRNTGMKIRHTVSLKSKRMCSYCSWTQASKIHCTSTADLIKTVIHFSQAQLFDQNGALYSMAIFAFSLAFFLSLNYRGRVSLWEGRVHADVGLGLFSSWISHLSSLPVSDRCRSSLWISLVGMELSEGIGVN